MGFKCGIVGLPNVGKSTLFNALTQTAAAQAANYPFCTIEPNVGDVAVPDPRLDALAALMLVLVHFVALLVQIYSISYLRDEAGPRLARYVSYLQLFVGAMLGIVLAGNLFVLYAFWELVRAQLQNAGLFAVPPANVPTDLLAMYEPDGRTYTAAFRALLQPYYLIF